MNPQFTQLVNALERAAPARGPAVNAIQPAEVKPMVIADLKRLGFSDAPFHQGIGFVLNALRLIRGDADIVGNAAFSFKPVYFFADEMSF
jgi:hypothetical protein